MLCDQSDTCLYYTTHKYRASRRQYQLLVDSYCEGVLQPMCKRLKYRQETGEEPPDELCPNGYRAGSHHKLYR
jgi:hypothetical protein